MYCLTHETYSPEVLAVKLLANRVENIVIFHSGCNSKIDADGG